MAFKRCNRGALTVFPSGLCVAGPATKNLFETSSRFCVRVLMYTVDSFKNIYNFSRHDDVAWFHLYYKEASHCVGALELMLQDESRRNDSLLVVKITSCRGRISSSTMRLRSSPFDCPEGRQVLASRPHVCWGFQHFDWRYPENLLECRYLYLDDVHIQVNPRFERHLNTYRGSLSLVERKRDFPMLEVWLSPSLHLDVLCLSLAFIDTDRVDTVASISCNWLVWKPAYSRSCHECTPALVSRMACPIGLDVSVYCTDSDPYQHDGDRVRFAAQALELTHHENVRELNWAIGCNKRWFSPDKFYAQLSSLGRLDVLAIFIHVRKGSGVIRQVVEALTLPPPALRLQIYQVINAGPHDGALRRLLEYYVRKHEHLVEFDFCDGLLCCSEMHQTLGRDLRDLAQDNAWLSLLRNNPFFPISAIVLARHHRPTVLYFALRQHAAEVLNYG